MSATDDRMNRRLRAAAQAAEWASAPQNEMSEQQRGEFVDWLRESPLHVAEMLRFEQTRSALAEFKQWDEVRSDTALAQQPDVVVPLSAYVPRRAPAALGSSWRKPLRLAACVAALLIAGGVWYFARPVATTVISTQHLERREMTLADGSVVNIAPDSELRITLTAEERSLVLDRGEALFHVAKDRLRPFVVTADHTRVRAVGTTFSVARQPTGIVITVAEGRVDVKPRTPARNPDPRGEGVISLGANEQVTVSPAGIAGRTRSVDGSAALARVASQLVFENDSVAEVAQRFNNRNRVQIRILDPQLAARPVSGIFNASDPQSFVSFREAAAGAQIVKHGSQEILFCAPPDRSASQDAR